MKTLVFSLFIAALVLLTGCASQPTTNMTGFEIDTDIGPLDGPRACRVARKKNPNEVC